MKIRLRAASNIRKGQFIRFEYDWRKRWFRRASRELVLVSGQLGGAGIAARDIAKNETVSYNEHADTADCVAPRTGFTGHA